MTQQLPLVERHIYGKDALDDNLAIRPGGRAAGSKPSPDCRGHQAVLDEELARILRESEERAVDLISTHRDVLDKLSGRLLAEETIDGAIVC